METRSARFPRADRLHRSWEFRRANRRGRRTDGGEFVVLVAPIVSAERSRTRERRRLGVTVSKKVGNAVVRNRVKRRVREWFRTHSVKLPADVDVVVIARRAAAPLSSAEVTQVLDRALARSQAGSP